MMDASAANPWEIVKNAVPISQYIARHSDGRKPMKRVGDGRFMAFCPLHDNMRTPAMSIDDKKGAWHCFSGCGGGSIIDFWVAAAGLPKSRESSRAALEALAKELSLKIDLETQGDYISPSKIKKAIGIAVRNLAAHLQDDVETSLPFWKYAENRGLLDFVDSYSLGAAPENKDLCIELMTDGDDSIRDVLVEGGLLYKGDRGYWSPFAGRLIVPIAVSPDIYVGIAGREIDGARPYKPGTKWINPSETTVFRKRTILFGQDRFDASENVRPVIVEGYFDAMAISHGNTDVPSIGLAVCGTSLSHDHANLLKRFPEITMMFDGDEAGFKALLRSMWIAQSRNRVNAVLLDDGKDPFDLYSTGSPIPVVGSSIIASCVEAAKEIAKDDDSRFDELIQNAIGVVDSRALRSQILSAASNVRGMSDTSYFRTISLPGETARRTDNAGSSVNRTLAVLFATWIVQAEPNEVKAITSIVRGDVASDVLRTCFPDMTGNEESLLLGLLGVADFPHETPITMETDSPIFLSVITPSMSRSLVTHASDLKDYDFSLRTSLLTDRIADGRGTDLDNLVLCLETALGMIVASRR